MGGVVEVLGSRGRCLFLMMIITMGSGGVWRRFDYGLGVCLFIFACGYLRFRGKVSYGLEVERWALVPSFADVEHIFYNVFPASHCPLGDFFPAMVISA